MGVYALPALQAEIAANPQQWRPLVLTNGCFDLLHPGHVRYLQAARSLGQALVVGTNTDGAVRQLKPAPPGYPQRPILGEAERAELLAALGAVDGVVVFAETTASALLRALQPEFYAKGGDYTLAELPEAPAAQACGAEIALMAIDSDCSSSAIIERILAARASP
ncbi:MAG: D-glycero-beta-D-manno-heptose 1-phosphate adenylyltransferase [Cyanobacteria bacterium QS_8_64_29]|nr:MAG: D-glycero-beta-D-manno-heptose 1-phosphate adenylyltransferase [Cyanobacteria bacterium QS_8_64_29]